MTNKTWRPWYPADDRRLERLRNAGLSRHQIAAEMGRTWAAVKCRLKTLEVLAPEPVRRRSLWLDLLCRPHRIATVAAVMGVTRQHVSQMKVRLRRQGWDVPAAERGKAS